MRLYITGPTVKSASRRRTTGGSQSYWYALDGPQSKILFRLQRFTSAVRCYRVGLTLLGSTRRGGLAVTEYFAIYFAVFTVLTLTLIH
jgi:hypothetical protein